MTRAEAAQIFYNLLLDKSVPANSDFDDVGHDDWYYNSVKTFANIGMIKGKDGNLFDPDGEITRAEFTAIAMRFVNVDVDGTEIFDDVPKEHRAAEIISDAAALGWITGNGDGAFDPDKPITRAAVVRIVNNMLAGKADAEYLRSHSDSINLFADVSDLDWFYGDVTEATNAHDYEKNGDSGIWK